MNIYNFAKKENKNVKKIRLKKKIFRKLCLYSSLSIKKLNKIIKK